MNKEFTRMQKLAGIITEGLYTSDAKAPMEAVSHDGESRVTKRALKEKIKNMMLSDGVTEGSGKMYYHVLEDVGGEIGYQGYYDTKEEAQKRANDLADMFPRSFFYVEASNSKREPHNVTLEGETPGELAYKAVDSLDEADSDYTMDAYRIAREMIRRMDFPDAMFKSKDLFLATIKALQDELYSYAEDQFGNAGSAPDEYDDYDDSTDVYDDQYPDMAEGDLSEAKKDKESDTEDVIVADTEEVPAEDAAVDVTASDTQVDVNMDGVPDVDTGSAESKKAFTSLVDTYNASKQLGDPKLTQMIANALTYYNKNIILKTGQPQA